MEVEVVNTNNMPLHYGDDPAIKQVLAPDYLPKRILYSGMDGRKRFEKIEQDSYESARKSKKRDMHKFPLALKILLGGLALTGAVVFRKEIFNGLKKFVKNPFKKS